MLTKLRTENDVSREGRCDMSAEPKQNPAVHGGRWWRSRRIKWPRRGGIPPMNLNQNFETIEPERLLTPTHVASRRGIQTSKIWSAFGSGQLGLVMSRSQIKGEDSQPVAQ